GHGGSITSDYAASQLPSRIHASLSEMLDEKLSGKPEKGVLLARRVTYMLQKTIQAFDDSIGGVVKEMFPRVQNVEEEEIKKAIEDHQDALLRAHQGSTVAGALINLDLRDAWVFNLGDSSVAISHANVDPSETTPSYNALTKQHLAYRPEEYCMQALEHPSKENFAEDGYILGVSEITRALGDHHFKLPAKYVRHVFGHLPPRPHFDYSGDRIKTPPYISSRADVGYVDIASVKDVKLFLYTDGVDDIIQWLHRPGPPNKPRKVKPSQILAYLASESKRAACIVGDELGHAVEPRWNGADGNRAVDILANLLGGTDTERMSKVLDPAVLRLLHGPGWDENEHIYIDDTTLIVCELTS
ncbi:hypothetical protein PENSPDRAFT_590894, partial [Peniophora sp. CONT]